MSSGAAARLGWCCGEELGPSAADLDELRKDRKGDLLGGLGPEVDAGRGAQGSQSIVGKARLVTEPRPDGRCPRGRGNEPDVARLAAERAGEGLLVPLALGRDDDE